MTKNTYDVIVIGAGAAGTVAAGFAARRGLCVALLERNPRLGRKLMITGKGRCNVTNNCDAEGLMRAVRSNGRFLYSALSRFGARDTMDFFEALGVPLKTERGNRVFPESDKAVDIVDALARFVRESGAHLLPEHRCASLLLEDGAVRGVRLADGGELCARSVIVATGGKSYPATGSTGDGYALARQAGHSVTQPTPSLIPIVTNEAWCAELMGLSLRNVTVTLTDAAKKGKPPYSELGEMLFTHFGVSGPLILSASSHMEARRLADYAIHIDLKPALSVEQLDARILRDFSAGLNRSFQNSLSELLPRKLIPVAVRLSGIPGDTRVNQITREQRRAFAMLLKDLTVTPQAFRPIEEAIVTAGGVNVKELDPKTMGSKLAQGLFFAGEVLDVDAYTGGYNLQLAFSTGVLAGEHA